MLTTALVYLTWTGVITALMWVPPTLQMMQGQGVLKPFGNRDDVAPLAPWAERAKRAHANSVENLAVFAALVLTAHVTAHAGSTLDTAALIYFWARVGHWVCYVAGIRYARTAFWTVDWLCLLAVAALILS